MEEKEDANLNQCFVEMRKNAFLTECFLKNESEKVYSLQLIEF